jgi:GT2 family glycosyltransferase
MGDQPFLSVTGRAPRAAQRPAWPPEFDSDGAVPRAAWERWLALTRPPATHARVRLVFVLGGQGGAEDAAAETRRAILALDAASVVCDAPPAEPYPDALHVFVQAGDRPTPELFDQLAAAARSGARIVTFDLFRPVGDRVQPLFSPGANPVWLQACDANLSRGALSAEVLFETPAGSLRDRMLAWTRARGVTEVRAGWRHLGRPLLEVTVSDADLVRSRTPSPAQRATRTSGVSVVICTKDKGRLTRQLVRQLLTLGGAVHEVVIVSNNTTHPYALRTLEDLAREPKVRVLRRDEPFNFSRLCNAGVRETRGGGDILLLNDDIAPVQDDWLEYLRAALGQTGVGAVGPLLLYPSEQVQHAGMYLRFPQGAGHALRGADVPSEDPLGLTAAPREVSCLTGAVLLTDRRAFAQVGGLDEALAISFQDVDYGLKLHQAGLRNVFEPRSVLLHMESVSLAKANTDPGLLAQRHREKQLMLGRWSAAFPTDPFLPVGLDPADERLRRLSRP